MLHVHRSERADRLADGLAETLKDPPTDPFLPDVVAVPTRGIERWLTQRLSTSLGASPDRSDGVCANIEFPFPGHLIIATLAEATGIDPDRDPWRPERSVWPLIELVDECIDEPWLETLKAHLEGARPEPDDPIRRFGVVRHIADLFDHYGVHRPEMICGWAAGEDAGAGEASWQAELWRRLRAKLDAPSPAERIKQATAAICNNPQVLSLPPRLALFGLTRMPRSHLAVLAAVAQARDVHLFVLHPSPALWRQTNSALTERSPVTRRDQDPTADLPANRLLASWGRDARELQVVLADSTATTADHHHELKDTAKDTLLSRIQAAVHADQPPPSEPLPDHPDERPTLEPNDHSLQIHSCHGRARQVEVLRDVILHLLQDDPTLEPRDIIVMCPDIETFAPLIEATFGTGTGTDDDADLRVRLADRSLRQTNPLLNVISQLLILAEQRVTASQLLDLADRAPVRRRFGFDDDAVARMHDWVVESGIRWGFDAPHRRQFKLEALEANTWRAGLDRILVGVAMTEHDRQLVADKVLPLDDVESGVIDLAGRFAEFVARAEHAVDQLQRPKSIADWGTALAEAADGLTATTARESWQRAELQRVLDDVTEQASQNRTLLELADIRALLAERLRGRPTRANFRTGNLTVCTLVPMRSVPHRVVCVLGLDDGAFPRKAPRDGDDLLLRRPHVGDRDPRAEDRQMLLDALLAATERLVITYTGNDERTNLSRPPAVPVGELLDIVDRTVRTDGAPARDHVLIRHPLQPFDPRNFESGVLTPEERWSFDQTSLGGAEAISGNRIDPPEFLSSPLSPKRTNVVELQRLVRFVEHPAKAFLRDRLGVSVGEYFDDVQDSLPVELDGLGEWQVGQRLLEGVLEGQELKTCVNAEFARGSLPPGTLANPVIRTVAGRVQRIAAALGAEQQQTGPAASLDVNLELPDGRRLTGTVPGVCGETIRIASYSRVKPKDRLRAWVWLLALTASRPEHNFDSLVVGRARSKAAEVTIARIPPLAGDATTRRQLALDALTTLVDLYDRGMREALPLTCEASAAYAEAAYHGDDPHDAARYAWESGFNFDKEDRDPEHIAVHDGTLKFSELLRQQPHHDEHGPGWADSESTRFGRYARRLWDPLLERELLTDQ